MGKSKNKPNAFWAFMIEWKRIQETKGRTFPNGLKDVQIDPECNEDWKNIPEEEKLRYKLMAKNDGAPKIKKRTGNGELVEDLRNEAQRQKAFNDKMVDYINDMVKMAKVHNAMPDIKFFVIHVNYFYYRQNDNNHIEYYPAEIAIGEFTLRNGLSRVYHVIINETPKIGFTQTSKEQSLNTHQIPIELPSGKNDYSEIYNDICKFLGTGQNRRCPPMYTVKGVGDIYECARSVLSRLAAANNESDQFFTLYSFEDFFTILHNAIDVPDTQGALEPMVALIEIKKDTNAYKPGLCCTYHEGVQVGTLYCSQSLIQRWFFVLCNFCCEPLGIVKKPGIHIPKAEVISLESLTKLSISNKRSRRGSSSVSMSEVSFDSNKDTSERTYAEEQRRRAEANARPFHVVERGHPVKLPPVRRPQEVIVERPLRAPHTKSATAAFDSATDTESIDLSECSFPSIGRGGAIKKRTGQEKPNGVHFGHGYADIVKH